MEHTPGPWRTVPDNEHEYTIKADDIFIAQVYGVDPGCDANAALIAAAPDLLAALEEFATSFIAVDHWGWQLLEQAQAAIHKATGEE